MCAQVIPHHDVARAPRRSQSTLHRALPQRQAPPAQTHKIYRLRGIRQATSESFPIRQQGIIPIAAIDAAGDTPCLAVVLDQGLDAGLTANDAKIVLLRLYACAGFPYWLYALRELMKMDAARKQRGLQDKRAADTGSSGNAAHRRAGARSRHLQDAEIF